MSAFDPSNVDVLDMLEVLDIDNVTQATEYEVRYSCPFSAHDSGDETPSAYMNLETSLFFCHSCHAKGSAIHFTAGVLDVSLLEAVMMLKQKYSPFGINPDARNMVEEVRKYQEQKVAEPKENQILDEALIHDFDIDWHEAHYAYLINGGHPATDYMFDRGFTADTLTHWQFGWDVDSNRITLPVRNEDGLLVGFKARAIDNRKPKYLNLGGERYGFPSFLKNLVVFGLDRARNESTDLILVEGEFNVVKLWQHGIKNAVAINGSYFGPRQIRMLRDCAERVTLFFDTDEAGYDATQAVSQELTPFMPVHIVPDHDGDPADMSFEEITACLDQSISSIQYQTVLRSQ